MEIRNLTPHAITLMPEFDQQVPIAPSGFVARCSVTRTSYRTIDDLDLGQLPLATITYGEDNLPPPIDGVMLIVSIVVALASRRSDLLVVDDEVRDQDGRIIGARRLAQLR